MAVYPGAAYRPLNEFSYEGDLTNPLGAILHVNVSAGPSLYNWIKSNPSRPNDQMSCHFQVAYDGTIEQYVDTANASWCQTAGNRTYISIETEGFPHDALTDMQVTAIAELYAWLHRTHGIPLTLAEEPGQRGFGWHGMGGGPWGGHPDCPGDIRKGQRAHILSLINSPTQPDLMEWIMSLPGAPQDLTYDRLLDDIAHVVRHSFMQDDNGHTPRMVTLLRRVPGFDPNGDFREGSPWYKNLVEAEKSSSSPATS